MRYTFNNGTDGNLNDAGNWTPAGGPPGVGDSALFLLSNMQSETLTGSATVGGAEFTHRASSTGNESWFTLDNVAFSATSLLVDQATLYENGGSMTASALQVSGGSLLVQSGGTLQTSRTLLKPVGDGLGSGVYAAGGNWTNTGNVVFGPDPYDSAGGVIAAEYGGTVTIGGNVAGGVEPSYDAHVDVNAGLLTVAGSVNIAGGAEISALGGGSIHVAGDMFINAQQTDAAVGASVEADAGYYSGQSQWVVSTVDVGHNFVLGDGAMLEPDAGLISVGNKLALLDGSTTSIAGGTIDAPTIVLSGMAFLTAETAKDVRGPGQNTIAGVNGGATTVFNGGTIDVNNALTVNGDIRGHGTLLVGDPLSPTAGRVDAAVNGTLAGQDIQFGAPFASLYADHFGADTVQYFGTGDIIASPGIQSIAYDPSSGTLSMNKGGGTVERLHMIGDFTGQTFKLSHNEYILLQPAPAQV